MAPSSMNESLMAMFPTPSCRHMSRGQRPWYGVPKKQATHDEVPAGLPTSRDGLVHHVVGNEEVRLELQPVRQLPRTSRLLLVRAHQLNAPSQDSCARVLSLGQRLALEDLDRVHDRDAPVELACVEERSAQSFVCGANAQRLVPPGVLWSRDCVHRVSMVYEKCRMEPGAAAHLPEPLVCFGGHVLVLHVGEQLLADGWPHRQELLTTRSRDGHVEGCGGRQRERRAVSKVLDVEGRLRLLSSAHTTATR